MLTTTETAQTTQITILEYARIMYQIYGKGLVYIQGKQITYKVLGLKTPTLDVNYYSQFLVQIRNQDRKQTAILDITKNADLEWLSTQFTVPINWKELEQI